MGGGVTAFRSGVDAPVAMVPPTSFYGQRERQRGELRVETDGGEKERAGVTMTESRGGSVTLELEAVGGVAEEGGRRQQGLEGARGKGATCSVPTHFNRRRGRGLGERRSSTVWL
jgi:hypothetical protein